jgi:hypothetical protein
MRELHSFRTFHRIETICKAIWPGEELTGKVALVGEATSERPEILRWMKKKRKLA